MGGHDDRLGATYSNLVLGVPTPAAGSGNKGSVNFIFSDRSTAWFFDPTQENEARLLELFDEFKKEGHLTLRKKDDEDTGEPTYAVEQAVPGMHGEYLFAAGGGVMLKAKPGSRIFAAAREFVLDELALALAFRFPRSEGGDDGVYIPAPRVKEAGHGAKKGQTSAQTGKQPMIPHDGYRDVRLKLALGEPVPNRPEQQYWRQPQSIGVWVMRELCRAKHPNVGHYVVPSDVRLRPVPKLFAPITKVSLVGGGFLAHLEDSQVVRDNTIDIANWCMVRPRGDRAPANRKKKSAGVEVLVGYDWKALPEVETIPGSEVIYGVQAK